ncbi:MAG: DNA-binding protein [Thermodesulfobacteriota bacterium]
MMMKRQGLAATLAFVLSILLVSGAAAGERLMKRRAPDGWGPGSVYGRMFDLATLETVTGKVTSIGVFTPPGGSYSGVRMTIDTGTEELSVHIGPRWFITNQDFELAEGETVEVTGSRVTYEGGPAIIASHMARDDSELLLRDEEGIPYWEAYRRGRAGR